MAKDVSEKPVSTNNNNNNSTETTSPTSVSDQQKVPPLRIVLNTSGNQKSSSQPVSVNTIQASQPQPPVDLKRQPITKPQDNAKGDANSNTVKSGGKVRIKLGTNKQQPQQQQLNKTTTTDSSVAQIQVEDAQKLFTKSTTTINDKQENTSINNKDNKEELTASYSHLRRITRRSQRAVQALNNIDDEESISSMTSTDENQNTTNNNNSDITNSQDNTTTTTTSTNATSSSSSSQAQPNTSNSSTSNSSTNVDGSRRYKRRKGETSESQLSEHEILFNYQNYKIPNQNSFELYRNIRKQVEKRLKNLTKVHPKTPHGFRDYMLTRGAYLLDGNKLGNGTNLFMNEEGGLYPAPVLGKYHAWRHNRVNYSVPNRAKVPLGLPVNSPLYNLFIDQEKERYKLRMQHIKEREKLTLAAEQEIVRVYNQAAMAAANQLEPFSACTMLKHQEVYNYMDSDGVTIQAAEDVQQDLEAAKQEGVRTRRRQHEHIAQPPPTRKPTSTLEEKEDSSSNPNSNNIQQQKETGPTTIIDEASDKTLETKNEKPSKEMDVDENITHTTPPATNDLDKTKTLAKEDEGKEKLAPEESEAIKEEKLNDSDSKIDENIETESASVEKISHTSEVVKEEQLENTEAEKKSPDNKNSKTGVEDNGDKLTHIAVNVKNEVEDSESKQSPEKDDAKKVAGQPAENSTKLPEVEVQEESESNNQTHHTSEQDPKPDNMNESATTEIVCEKLDNQVVLMEEDDQASKEDQDQQQNPIDPQATESTEAAAPPQPEEPVLSDDDRRAYNKEVFLCQLQEIDDKWEKIRNDMLVRHKNEAESLHAVQRLEWEWKTKEIGACDVRSALIIDDTLVPKLNIYLQDY